MPRKSLAILVAIIALLGGGILHAEPAATQPATAPSNPGIEPLRITLHFKSAPVVDVIKSIQWQTGMSLFVNHQMMVQFTDKKIMSIDVDNATFWDVMRELGDKAGLHAMRTQDNSGRVYNLMPFRIMNVPAPTEWTDLFSVAPLTAMLSRTISYASAQGNGGGDFHLALQVVDDPAIDLWHLKYETLIQSAEDENGRSLLQDADGVPTRRPGVQEARVGQLRMLGDMNGGQLWLALTDSAKNGKKIARLRGTIHVTGTSPVHPVLIPDAVANSSVSDFGSQIDIVDITHKGANYSVRLAVKQSPTAIQWNPVNSPGTTYSMINDNGDLFLGKTVSVDKEPTKTMYTVEMIAGPSNGGGNFVNNGVVIANGRANFVGGNQAVQPQDEPPAATQSSEGSHSVLVINLPAAPVDYSVPFELKDLPLP